MPKLLCTTLSIVILSIVFSANTMSEAYTPSSPDRIIASWENTATLKHNSTKLINKAKSPLSKNKTLNNSHELEIIKQSESYLKEAQKPGFDYLNDMARNLIHPLIQQDTQNAKAWLLWADIQQRQHEFEQALTSLKRISHENNTHALLMEARIHIINGHYKQAKQSCLKTLGNTDLLTSTACNLEANSYLNKKLDRSYQLLSTIAKSQSLPTDARGPWIRQTLAEMASRLNYKQQAADWLDQARQPNSERPYPYSVSYLSDWADAHLALGHHEKVVERLTRTLQNLQYQDDALLLRLAIAEKSSHKSHWLTTLKQRIELREIRHDTLHASDIARFYIDISPNAEKAQYWATLNFKKTKEHKDKTLLANAISM